jgi:hypothetical protein
MPAQRSRPAGRVDEAEVIGWKHARAVVKDVGGSREVFLLDQLFDLLGRLASLGAEFGQRQVVGADVGEIGVAEGCRSQWGLD